MNWASDMNTRQKLAMLGIAALAAANAYQLWIAGHTVAAFAFGVLLPAGALREYPEIVYRDRPDPVWWRATTASERHLQWILMVQLCCIILGWGIFGS